MMNTTIGRQPKNDLMCFRFHVHGIAMLRALTIASGMLLWFVLSGLGDEPLRDLDLRGKVVLEWTPGTHAPLSLSEMEEICTQLLTAAQIKDPKTKGEIYWRRSQIRFWLDNGTGYLADVRAANELIPNHAEIRRLYGHRFSLFPAETAQCIAEAEQLMRELPMEHHGYYLAGRLVQPRDQLKSIEYFTKAINRRSDFAPAYLMRAFSYIVLGKYTEGLQDAEKTLDLPPVADQFTRAAEMAKGLALFELDRPKEAIPYLERNIGQPNEQEATLFALWICYEATGRFATSLSTAKEHVRQFPQESTAHAHLARSFATFGRIQDAFLHARKAIELHDKSALAWSTLARVQMSDGDYGGAIESFRRAIKIDKYDRDAAILLAYLLVSSEAVRSRDEAKTMLELALIEGAKIKEMKRVKIIKACVAANDEQFQKAEKLVTEVIDDQESGNDMRIIETATFLRSLFHDKKPFRLEQGKKRPQINIPLQPPLIEPTSRR
ncbi:MAG: hypothetical protein JWM11_7937 [Planctomycetaceae bacterium]|nr:hypothetical protein [Planctomycetaceae bacterium]